MTQEQDALPSWAERGEDGAITANGQLLRFEMFLAVQVAWTDTDPAVPLEYLDAAHKWILDGKTPGKPKLAAVK